MTGRPATLELRGVSKSFAERSALRGLDLDVHAGEVFGLVGPNGAGKTTALRAICGLIAPDSGTIRIAGSDIADDPLAARRQLAFVPDGAPLYPGLSAREHLLLVARLRLLPAAQGARRASSLLEALELADSADRPTAQLSRGMRQKVALATALLTRPPLLVLDEPLTGLDAPSVATVKEVLRGIAAEGGAVLYTSHVLDVVERVCDRMAVLHEGRVRAEGDLDSLRRAAGRDGTLEEIFAALAHEDDAADRARRILSAAHAD